MAETAHWWLIVQLIGLIGLPITYVLFQRLPDRGYAFAKPAAILFTGFLFWLALSLHLLPNRPGSIVWCLMALGVVSALIARTRHREMLADLRPRLPVVLAVETVFLVGLFAAAHIRSFLPEISGTEKPMDFMLLNAASRSRFYPPDDAWLSGFSVSYYYFGYVIQAMLAKLSVVTTAVGFNLALASTAALAGTAAFGLGYNILALTRRADVRAAVLTGLAATVMVTLMGNLEAILEFARANGIGSDAFFRSMGIANLVEAQRSATWHPTEESSFWWWWRSTRISPDGNSITEFPFFSFLLGDLHPHVMALPFVLTVGGLGLAFWAEEKPLTFDYWRNRPGILLGAAVLLGGLGFLNTWDLPTFAFVVTLLVLARNLTRLGNVRQAALDTGAFMAPLLAVAVVLYLPFYVSFSSQASGLAAVSSSATRPLHSALFWLPLVGLTLPMVIARLAYDRESLRLQRLRVALALPGLLLVAWVTVLTAGPGDVGVGDAISARGWNWFTTLFYAIAFAAAALAFWREAETSHEEARTPVVVLAMIATGYLLVLGGELFFIKDLFGSRLNTVFKLYYQAWLLLAVAGSYGAYWLLRQSAPDADNARAEMLRGAWAGIALVFVAAALLYPLGATLSRTNGLSVETRTLDGLDFARRQNPDEVAAVDWLRSRGGTKAVIAEAVDGAYTSGGRISSRTGVPAVLGWPGHQTQWGRDGAMVAQRQADIERAYSSESLAEALEILRKYNVTYVFVGSIERSKYPPAGLQKFSSGLETAMSAGQSVLYRVPVSASSVGASP